MTELLPLKVYLFAFIINPKIRSKTLSQAKRMAKSLCWVDWCIYKIFGSKIPCNIQQGSKNSCSFCFLAYVYSFHAHLACARQARVFVRACVRVCVLFHLLTKYCSVLEMPITNPILAFSNGIPESEEKLSNGNEMRTNGRTCSTDGWTDECLTDTPREIPHHYRVVGYSMVIKSLKIIFDEVAI